MFICTKCGLCCRNIGKIPELAGFHTGNVFCMHLSDDNLCSIYATRPYICRVGKMYESIYKAIMSKTEYEKMNMEVCRVLQSKEIKDCD